MRRTFVLGALAGSAALLAAGCGSSSKSTSTTAAAPAATAAAQSAPAATSAAAPSSASAGVVITTKHSKYGTILAAGSQHMTVYLFEADKGSSSSCSGACVHAWPPVSSAAVTASGATQQAKLGTVTRPDGSKQVTYNGHPLYYFRGDGDQGDAYGQGSKAFGASWYVLAPSGNKVDTS